MPADSHVANAGGLGSFGGGRNRSPTTCMRSTRGCQCLPCLSGRTGRTRRFGGWAGGLDDAALPARAAAEFEAPLPASCVTPPLDSVAPCMSAHWSGGAAVRPPRC